MSRPKDSGTEGVLFIERGMDDANIGVNLMNDGGESVRHAVCLPEQYTVVVHIAEDHLDSSFDNLRQADDPSRGRPSTVLVPQAEKSRNENETTGQTGRDCTAQGTVVLFSLFDGRGIARKVCKKLSIRPATVVVAEQMYQLRVAVATECGYTAQPLAWTADKEGIPSIYLTDVRDLVPENNSTPSRVLQQAFSFAERAQHRYLLIDGSPFTDLTSACAHGGALGFCGVCFLPLPGFPLSHLSNPGT